MQSATLHLAALARNFLKYYALFLLSFFDTGKQDT